MAYLVYVYSGDKKYATGKEQQFTLQETIIHSYKIEMELKKHSGKTEERLGGRSGESEIKNRAKVCHWPSLPHLWQRLYILCHLSHPIFYFKAVSNSGLWGVNKVQVSDSAVSPWECSSALNSNESAEQFTQVFACQL